MDGTVTNPAPKAAARAPRPKQTGVPVAYRLAVASRFIVATFGGYLLASLSSICLALWLPLPRAEAVLAGMMLSFLAYLGAFIWCFSCRSAWHAWVGTLLPCALLGAAWAATRWLS
ncbi:DUF3649 domain-containing protein [Pseudomonas sp. 21LCFQ02]|uniref:DUF3649 domain-containing protein n=1 Tax=unclassified Pseudomonas TaxID=196821 RepID=UPI0004F6C35C|nr:MULTISPECIES: DUF3649 domain-containing protein [unclassified Pseudomonas]MCO8161408.1 DUF3649 domain-containing protein [Pseudomonas sp. 21LCFQ010]MCO8168151.1 DUF3649 domain-containing protein [Pseudomonas sp. 21LCFQ02]BAP41450.1 putative uncharacterized protein [Pseudomonas sp. StFLB209]